MKMPAKVEAGGPFDKRFSPEGQAAIENEIERDADDALIASKGSIKTIIQRLDRHESRISDLEDQISVLTDRLSDYESDVPNVDDMVTGEFPEAEQTPVQEPAPETVGPVVQEPAVEMGPPETAEPETVEKEEEKPSEVTETTGDATKLDDTIEDVK